MSTPARWNITDAACISSTGVLIVGAPALWATSASPVASMTRLCEDGLPAGLGFRDDPADRVAVHDRSHELTMQHGVDAGLLDEPVGHELEPFGVEFVAERLAFGDRRARRALARSSNSRPMPPASAVRLMPVPSETLDPDGGDVAAETAEALDEGHLDPGAGGRERGSEAPGPGADDEHVGLVDDGGVALRLADRLGHGASSYGPERPQGDYVTKPSSMMAARIGLGSPRVSKPSQRTAKPSEIHRSTEAKWLRTNAFLRPARQHIGLHHAIGAVSRAFERPWPQRLVLER